MTDVHANAHLADNDYAGRTKDCPICGEPVKAGGMPNHLATHASQPSGDADD